MTHRKTSEVLITVHPSAAGHRVPEELFGQFLERASWGEPGPEAAWEPERHALRADVMDLLQKMDLPVIRFPGGTDIDTIHWTDMVHLPEREKLPVSKGHKGHMITNNFGYDEYFALRNTLGNKTVLVVNFLDALRGNRSFEAAALDHLGLLAYVQANSKHDLPEGMRDWTAVRHNNGTLEPHQIEYIQIGNEWIYFMHEVMQATGLEQGRALAQRVLDALKAYIQVIRKIDKDLPIIIDLPDCTGDGDYILNDPIIKAEVRFVTFHVYAPMNMKNIRTIESEADPSSLTNSQWWRALVSMPGVYERGVCTALGTWPARIIGLGYLPVCTEWNWNGWNYQNMNNPDSLGYAGAAGLGAAAFLHGMIQDPNIKLATQSMLLGRQWQIAAIQYHTDPNQEAYTNPQGEVSQLLAIHKNGKYCSSMVVGSPVYEQPYQIGCSALHSSPIASLECCVTEHHLEWVVSIIQREEDDMLDVTIELPSVTDDFQRISWLEWWARKEIKGVSLVHKNAIKAITPCSKNTIKLRLSPRTLNLIRIPKPELS